jgi:hypothetical protein
VNFTRESCQNIFDGHKFSDNDVILEYVYVSGKSCSIEPYLCILGCYRIARTTTGRNTDVVDLVDSHITQTVAMTICLQAAPHHYSPYILSRQLYIHNLNGAMSLPPQVLQTTFFVAAFLTQLLHLCSLHKPQRWLLPRFL